MLERASFWLDSGRNVTCDNFFTDVQLCEQLLRRNTTLVGTIRKNKRDVPSEMQASKSRPPHSSIFAFNGQITMVSYIPKRSRLVILLSSMHHDNAVTSDEQENKPEIILHYNETKSGVDNLDHLIRLYSCKRATSRWPMNMFYNMIDVASIAAFVLWLEQSDWGVGKKQRRRLFLRELGNMLVLPQQERRLRNPRMLQKGVRSALQTLGFSVPGLQNPSGVSVSTNMRKRCHLCERQRDRKVTTSCSQCQQSTCSEHSHLFCNDCI